jgi:hypothetical protein
MFTSSSSSGAGGGTPGINRTPGGGGTQQQQQPLTPRVGRYSHREANGGTTLGNVLRHYDDPDRIYEIQMPRNGFTLGGFQLHDRAAPRGLHGLDAQEKEMRQLRADAAELEEWEQQQKRRGKALHQRDLFAQQMAERAADNDQRRAAELADDLRRAQRAPYGPSHDPRRELERKTRRRELLKGALEEQRRDKAVRDAFDAQHFAAAPEDWAAGLRELDERIRRARAGDAAGTAVPLSEQQKQQQRDGPRVIQDTRESTVLRRDLEEQPLSREVAAFADRILLAEVARREGRDRYRAELDQQVAANFHRRQDDITANLIIDRSYHIGAISASQLNSQQKLIEFRERKKEMMTSGSSASARAMSAGSTTRRYNANRANDSSSVAATIFGENSTNNSIRRPNT